MTSASVKPGLTKAQRRKLNSVPDDWAAVPFFGDSRPIAPLLRLGMIEERRIDVTPSDWGSGPIRSIRHEWRRTPSGRAALEQVQP